eukprot:jgi/Tetstr1/441207/TSEL_029463.t1
MSPGDVTGPGSGGVNASADGGPEYGAWPEEAGSGEEEGKAAGGGSLCAGLAVTIDALLLAFAPSKAGRGGEEGGGEDRKLPPGAAAVGTPSQALLTEVVERTGNGLGQLMSMASTELQRASCQVTASVERWREAQEEAERRKIVRRLVRAAFSKAEKAAMVAELQRQPFPGLAFMGSAKLLEGVGGQGERRRHMVSIAAWEEGVDAELLRAHADMSGYRVVKYLETEDVAPVTMSGAGLLRFRRWACRLKGWRLPGQATPRVIILGTFGVLKCTSGHGPSPSEKSIKYQAHQYMANLGAAYYGIDYMGHGPPEQKMPGNGFMVSSAKLHLVLRQCLETLAGQFPRVPIFLHGECYGAMLSLAAALDEGCMAHVSGVIHNSAPIHRRGVTEASGLLPRSLIQVADWMMPPRFAERFLEERRVGPMPGWFLAESPQTWNDTVKLADHCQRNARRIFRRVPTLGIYSLEDPLVSVPKILEDFHVVVEESAWEPRNEGFPGRSFSLDSLDPSARSASAGDDLLPRAPLSEAAGSDTSMTLSHVGSFHSALSPGVELSMVVSFDEDNHHLIRDSEACRDCALRLECAWIRLVLERRTLEPLAP